MSESSEDESKTTTTSSSNSDPDKLTSSFDLDKLTSGLPSLPSLSSLPDLSLPDLSSIAKNSESIFENVWEGEFGTRGEAYVVVQAVLILCVAIGGIPVVGDFINIVLGPGLFLTGIAIILSAVTEMGSSLSPWPVPARPKNELVTSGVFAKVRHPIYAGLLALCVGLSVLTGSASRLLLTAVLLYVLEVKSDYEEDQLQSIYPEYDEYKKEVTGKFFPHEILDKMPWKQDSLS